MELKVWCDGIPRVVCGASSTTTCQDVVFALAHATGQVGRFILIEKWRNNERVLAPGDRPLASLSKWGEYANDVTFVMKKSGDVSQSKPPKQLTSMINKKSDSALAQARKALVNSHLADQNIPPMMSTKSSADLNHSATLPHRHHKAEPFVRSISFHKPTELSSSQNSTVPTAKRSNRTSLYQEQTTFQKERLNSDTTSTKQEPLYSTLSMGRPPQPPPYTEAIAKSSLFNGTSQNNGIYGFVGGSPNSSSLPSSHFAPNGTQHGPLHEHQLANISLNSPANFSIVDISPNKTKNLSHLHQDTRNLIDQQQQTMGSQKKDIDNIEKELHFVSRQLTENEQIVLKYQEEMDTLKQIWMEKEALIEELQEEQLEEEWEQLVTEVDRYEAEMREVKQRLTDCETEILQSREEIGSLMSEIDEAFNVKSQAKHDDEVLLRQFQSSIQERIKEIDLQNSDLSKLETSIEQLEKTIKEKNDLMSQLMIEIKDANVEGLSLQSSGLYVEERDTSTGQEQGTTGRPCSNRKIPVLPHDLGSTVPTKKHPDGIWV